MSLKHTTNEEIREKITEIYQFTQEVESKETEETESSLGQDFEHLCDMYAEIDTTIKNYISERQSRTKELKKEVEAIEKPYRALIKSSEQTKDSLHREISKIVLEQCGEKPNVKVGSLAIRETTPKRTFEASHLEKVPLEFLKIDEEAVNCYVDLFGTPPEGVLMCEERRCIIVHSSK